MAALCRRQHEEPARCLGIEQAAPSRPETGFRLAQPREHRSGLIHIRIPVDRRRTGNDTDIRALLMQQRRRFQTGLAAADDRNVVPAKSRQVLMVRAMRDRRVSIVREMPQGLRNICLLYTSRCV